MRLFRNLFTRNTGRDLRAYGLWKGMLVAFLMASCIVIRNPPACASIAVQIGQNFTASTLGVDSDSTPPDAGLAVGTNHVVQFINGRYSVFNKTNAAKVQTMTDSTFWANAGITLSANLNVTDPRILFDQASHRWFALMIDYDSVTQISNRFLLAVSATSDPTGTWLSVAVPADPMTGYFADFPTLGIDASAVYLGGDMFDSAGNPVGETLVSIPKTNLLANPPTTSGRTWFGILDSGTYGQILLPAVTLGTASTAETVLAMGDLGYDAQPHSTLITFGVGNGALPGGAFLNAPATLSVPEYLIPANPTQPNGLSDLDDGDARLSATVYRVGDLVYAVHSTEVNSRAAIQWFEINAVSLQVVDTGIISDPTLDLFYPSIAANASGTVVIACNGCSLSSFVSCYAVTGEKVNGTLTFGSLLLLKPGVTSYRNEDSTGVSRWGDYSAVSVDPADPNRFWTLTMYPATRTTWSTQLTELIVSPVRLGIARSGTNVIISWPSAATGFQLQSITNLSSGTWTAVTQMQSITNNQITVSLSSTGTAKFFRLVK